MILKQEVFVYVTWAGMKIGINFTSYSGNSNFAVIAKTSGIYPKISLLQVLSQINTITKVKISDFQTHFHNEYALPTPARHTVKVENRSGLTFLCIGRRLTHFSAKVVADSFP